MSRVGLCIVGCGRMAARHGAHAAAARSGRGEWLFELSFASRAREKAEAYRRRFGGARAYGSYDEAFADRRVEAVLLCTPHHLHRQGVLRAARAGKHVLVEKPLALTLEDADLLENFCRQEGVVLMAAENFAYKPSVLRAAALLRAGAIGRVSLVRVNALTHRERGDGWRASRESMGGGALIDGGIHWVDTLRRLGGEPEEVFALAPPKVLGWLEGEDGALLLARLGGGALGELHAGWGTPGGLRPWFSSAHGDEGSLYVENNGRLLLQTGRRLRPHFLPRRDRHGFGGMLEAFWRAVREGAPPPTSAPDARRSLAVVLAAYRSLETGRPVPLAGAPAGP